MTTELPAQWEKLKVLSTLIATLAIPVVLALVANSFSKDQKEKEIGIRYVELAVQILRSEPNSETKALRTWAISIIDHYSQVPLPAEAKNELEFQQLKSDVQKLSVIQQETSKALDEMDKKAREAIDRIKGQR
jgi:hypothetical protein